MKKKRAEINGLPEDFVLRMQQQFPDDFESIISTFRQRDPVIRCNELLIKPSDLKKELFEQGIELEDVTILKGAFVAKTDRRSLTDLSIYKDGKFYIQSLASLLVVKALDPQPGEKILDLCAAPGSKTSQIAVTMKKEGELIANDNNKVRFYRLLANLKHQQVDAFVITKNYPGQNYPRFYPEYFDRVLVDAPCSSEARFINKHPKSIKYWSRHKVKAFAKLGKRLLDAAVKCTKPGGFVVYSTCTFSPEENELVLDAVLKKHPELKVLSLDWKIKKLPILNTWKEKELNAQIAQADRLYPDPLTEGFFICKLLLEKNKKNI